MSGCLRKLRDVVLLEASMKGNSLWGSSHPRCLVNCLHLGSYVRKSDQPLIGVQKRYKWDWVGGGDEHQITRKIRAESNCLRCSKQMDLLFTNCPHQLIPPISSNHDQNTDAPNLDNNDIDNKNGSNNSINTAYHSYGDNNSSTEDGNNGGNVLQAVNLCPNCKTAYYFRSFKMSPLQGSFIEIGRVKSKTLNSVKKSTDSQLRPSFWETLRSYGGEPPENWPPHPPPPMSGMIWRCIHHLGLLLRLLSTSFTHQSMEMAGMVEKMQKRAVGVGLIWAKLYPLQRRSVRGVTSLLLARNAQRSFFQSQYIITTKGYIMPPYIRG